MRSRLLTDKGIDSEFQRSLEQSYLIREERLGYRGSNRLFKVVTEILETRSKIGLRQYVSSTIQSIKPLDDATLIMCDLYREKYGINMHPLLADKDSTPGAQQITLHLDKAGGQPFGLIVPCRVDRPQRNYQGHVAPCLLQQIGPQIQIVNLDSLPALYQNPIMLDFMRMQSNKGVDTIQFKLKDERQGSQNGCKVDAIQTLKDALVYYKRGNFGSLYELLGGHESGRISNPKELTSKAVITDLKMPSFLHKTVQRSNFLETQGHEPTEKIDPRPNNMAGVKAMDIGQHRKKYSAPMCTADKLTALRKKEGNHFLLVKAYYQIGMVLNKLESFTNAADREHYLRQLSRLHG